MKHFMKEITKKNQQGFRIPNSFEEKEISFMSNGKYMIIHLVVGLIKNT